MPKYTKLKHQSWKTKLNRFYKDKKEISKFLKDVQECPSLSNLNDNQNDNVSSDDSDCVEIIKSEETHDTSFNQNIDIDDFKKITEIIEKGFQRQSQILEKGFQKQSQMMEKGFQKQNEIIKNGFQKQNEIFAQMSATIKQLVEANDHNSSQSIIIPKIEPINLSFNSLEEMIEFEYKLVNEAFNKRVVSI